MKKIIDLNKIINSVKIKHPVVFENSEKFFGKQLETLLYLTIACAIELNNSDNKPKELKQSDELTLAHAQLDQIANHLNAVPGDDLTADDLHDGVDTIANACIRKINKLIPNGDRLGELIDEVQKHTLPAHEILGRSQCHHLGKRLYTKIKDGNG